MQPDTFGFWQIVRFFRATMMSDTHMNNSQTGRPFNSKNLNPEGSVEVVGPPQGYLVPQEQGSGLTLGHQFCPEQTRFIQSHLSVDDNRIFDEFGRIMCVSHHYGKNPYHDTMEPLEIGGCEDRGTLIEEFQMEEPVCYVSGNYGMPNLRVKPKSVSMHGTQFVQDPRGGTTYFSISKQSRIKSMSTKHNMVVYKGDQERELMYTILVTGPIIQILNAKNERVAAVEKAMGILHLNNYNSVLSGPELTIDVAGGVDWTALLAMVFGLHQCAKKFPKDAFNSFWAASPEPSVMISAIKE